MATLVCFHAHPDDEAIATGGLMTLAKRDGHEVVLVLATRGEQGEPQPGVLNDGESLWERRVVETHQAAEMPTFSPFTTHTAVTATLITSRCIAWVSALLKSRASIVSSNQR